MGSTGRLCKEDCLETVFKSIGGGESIVTYSHKVVAVFSFEPDFIIVYQMNIRNCLNVFVVEVCALLSALHSHTLAYSHRVVARELADRQPGKFDGALLVLFSMDSVLEFIGLILGLSGI